jgi:predicted amidohydrolase YtcJ
MKKADIVLKSNAVFDSIGNMPFSGGVAIKGNRILAVIKGDGIDEYIGPDTKVFQYENQLIMPGFVDAHTHFFDGAVTSSDHMCDLSPSTSELEAVEMLKQYASTHPNEKRLRGIGWLPANWQDEGLPSKKSLDEAFPNIPVYCISADIHTFWMNSKALEESGYTPDFQPPSGSVGKYENGELNGLIFEPAAFEQAMEKTMEFDKEPLIALLKGFMAGIAENGITSVSEMSSYSYKDSV